MASAPDPQDSQQLRCDWHAIDALPTFFVDMFMVTDFDDFGPVRNIYDVSGP